MARKSFRPTPGQGPRKRRVSHSPEAAETMIKERARVEAPVSSRPQASRRPSTQGKSIAALAHLTSSVAPGVLRSVLGSGMRLEPALAEALRSQRDLRRDDRRLVTRCLAALLRYWGWIEPLRLVRIEEQLLLAGLLEFGDLHPILQVWARKIGRDPYRLFTAGDAPNWTAR